MGKKEKIILSLLAISFCIMWIEYIFSSAFWFTLNNVWYFFPVFSILFYIISGFLYFFFKIGQNKDIILVFVLQFLTIVVLIFWVSAIMY